MERSRAGPPHVNLGEVRAGRETSIEGIPHYRRALQLDPDNARAHHLLGVALVAYGSGGRGERLLSGRRPIPRPSPWSGP